MFGGREIEVSKLLRHGKAPVFPASYLIDDPTAFFNQMNVSAELVVAIDGISDIARKLMSRRRGTPIASYRFDVIREVDIIPGTAKNEEYNKLPGCVEQGWINQKFRVLI